MTKAQDDLLEIYNSLVTFSDSTVTSLTPMPIEVSYDIESKTLVFKQKGKSVHIFASNYYSLGLNSLSKKPTYLLPKDYDYLMSSLQSVIGSGNLLESRVVISPENYGFDVYYVAINSLELGPDLIASIRFVSGTSWLFKLLTKRKYKID